jgi:hypothetical protein
MNRLASVAVGAVLMLASCGAVLDPCDPVRLKFDHAAWIADQDQSGMLDDLIKNVLVVGDSREAVIDILGPPTNAESNVLRYDTACGDKWELRVWLDEKGLFTRATYHPY